MSVKVGDKAPDFTLLSKNMTGEPKPVSLADYKGKNLVLLFHPLAFTDNCTNEMCSVTNGLNEYTGLNADVIAIGVDTLFTQEAWAKAKGIRIPLLSDFNKEVAPKYGAFYDEFVLGMKGVAKRSAFVIDKEGIIQYVEVNDDPAQLPDFDKIKECLKSIG